jgi:hypothetical protein
MKKLLSIFICFVMIISTCGVSMANEAERDVFLNIKDKTIIDIMKNTVMIYPGAEKTYVYGKGVELDDYEVKAEDGKVYVPTAFLKQAFPEGKVTETEESDIYSFAEENDLKVSTVDGIIYIHSKDYRLPQIINSNMWKFFGIYVVSEGKETEERKAHVGDFWLREK